MTKKSLTDEQVDEIRELYESGLYTQPELAERFSCSTMTISLWADRDDTRRKLKFGKRVIKEPKQFNPDVLEKVKQLRYQGKNSLKIAEKLNIPLIDVNEMFIFLARGI